ncbi:MAG: 50S ribosomal protein L5, partial [Candidatus Komeilibacteria bacterium]|nr:50S ribosomal protein L5 [Candidatus Komeilibacteria bacterium]
MKQLYMKEIVPRLKKELGISNTLAVPRVTKLVLNVGLSKSLTDKRYVDFAEKT